MSSFTARVELHKDDKRKQTHSPDAKEYDNLGNAFSRRFYETRSRNAEAALCHLGDSRWQRGPQKRDEENERSRY
jgi:hypothetical protein